MLQFIDTDSFIVYIKTYDVCKDIAGDLETSLILQIMHRPSPKGKNKIVIELFKDELGGKIIPKFVGLRAKSYSYLIGNGSKDKKVCHEKKTS